MRRIYLRLILLALLAYVACESDPLWAPLVRPAADSGVVVDSGLPEYRIYQPPPIRIIPPPPIEEPELFMCDSMCDSYYDRCRGYNNHSHCVKVRNRCRKRCRNYLRNRGVAQ